MSYYRLAEEFIEIFEIKAELGLNKLKGLLEEAEMNVYDDDEIDRIARYINPIIRQRKYDERVEKLRKERETKRFCKYCKCGVLPQNWNRHITSNGHYEKMWRRK